MDSFSQKNGERRMSEKPTARGIAPLPIFLCGLFCIPAFVLQQNLAVRLGQVAVFLVISAGMGKRVRLLPNLIIIIGIVTAQILFPFGHVLFFIGRFPVTLGAIRSGILKSTLLIGMIYLSRLAVRADLRLPGRFGKYISRVFFYFEKLTGLKQRTEFKRLAGPDKKLKGSLVRRLDAILFELQNIPPVELSSGQARQRRLNMAGVVLIAALILTTWGVVLFARAVPIPDLLSF
jgi:hypothetical protein